MSTLPKVSVGDLCDVSEFAQESIGHMHTVFRAIIAVAQTQPSMTDQLARLGIFLSEQTEKEVQHWTANIESSVSTEVH